METRLATRPVYLAFGKTMRQRALLLSLCCFFAGRQAATAEIGGVANRGDNCTPFNGFAIGYPAGPSPSADTIVNQTVVLYKGSEVVGWILTLRNDGPRLVGYRPTGTEDESPPGGPPGTVRVASMSKADIRRAYEKLRQTALAAGAPPRANFIDSKYTLDRFVLSQCFSAPLPKNE